MDRRYRTHEVDNEWATRTQYRHWLTIGRAVAEQQRELGLIPPDAAHAILAAIRPEDLGRFQMDQILEEERRTWHDVAAFLNWWRDWINRHQGSGSDGKWAGYGMTSSDFVETAMGMRFRNLLPVLQDAIAGLRQLLDSQATAHARAHMLGRTHGQPAEPTTLGLRFHQWAGMVHRRSLALHRTWRAMQYAKLSGPVGTYAHNPIELEVRVALQLGLIMAGGDASQVVPRDRLAAWASDAAALVSTLAKIAVDFRLMAARGEVTEGWSPERVGSSSMPHKRNPVNAERISGMARLAQGYAQMLQPVDLWEDRDISHSSVERVAVPDLMHAVIFSIRETATLLGNAQWDHEQIEDNLLMADRLPYTAWATLHYLPDSGSRQQAERAAVEWADDPITFPQPSRPTAEALTRRHPLVRGARAWAGLTDKQAPQ